MLSTAYHLPSLLCSSNIFRNTSSSDLCYLQTSIFHWTIPLHLNIFYRVEINHHSCILISKSQGLPSTSLIVLMTLPVDLAVMHFTPFAVSDVCTNWKFMHLSHPHWFIGICLCNLTHLGHCLQNVLNASIHPFHFLNILSISFPQISYQELNFVALLAGKLYWAAWWLHDVMYASYVTCFHPPFLN